MSELDPEMIAVYRAMTPAERIQAGLAATELVRDRLRAETIHRHPDWDREQVEREVARRILESHDSD